MEKKTKSIQKFLVAFNESKNMIKNIFFDFDGVLAESVQVKTFAFRQMYELYGNDIADKVVAHHRANGGMSRFEKFRIWHQSFLGENISEEKVQQLARQFSQLVVEGVVASEEIKGATYFLDKYAGRLNCWVITGTPTPEMELIIARRNMAKYFKAICGSPEKKKYWTEFLIDRHQLKRTETLFLGDATSDYNAAVHSQLHFALRDYDENHKLFMNYEGMRFTNFYDLEKQLSTSQLLI